MGSIILQFDEIASTNDFAKTLARHGANEGVIVVADIQTQGKGRLKREWSSLKGGLWLSIILRPDLPPVEVQKVTLIAGIAVAKTLRDLFCVKAYLKWPNDVLVKNKKICGILTESAISGNKMKFVIVGIGLNITNKIPKELTNTATSLNEHYSEKIDIKLIFRDLIAIFEKTYDLLRTDPRNIIEQWKEYSDTISKDVKVKTGKTDIKGRAISITSDGLLKVRTKNGKIVEILAGDCIYVR